MAFLYAKSATWRWIVARSKESPAFFTVFGVACVGLPWGVAVGVQSLTNPGGDLSQNADVAEKKRAELLRRGRSDSLIVARINKERLGEFLAEIKRGDNTEDRYRAALDGKTLTGPPEARVRSFGSSKESPSPSSSCSKNVNPSAPVSNVVPISSPLK